MSCIHARTSAFACLFLTLLSACEQRLAAPIGSPRDVPASRGGSLHLASFSPLRSLDPAVAFDEGVDPIERLLFARILRLSPTGHFEGDLAESYSVSSDGLTLSFTLRSTARFHDGSPVTSHDVKRSLERALHKDTPCPAPSFYDHIRGYADFHAGKAEALSGIEIVSNTQFTIRLESKDAAFLAVLTLPFAAPVCPSAGARYAPSFAPCGAGPFKLDQWVRSEELHLARHEGYYAPELIHLDSITWLIGVPITTQRFRFERGELDFIHELSAADSVAFRRDSRWKPFGEWNRPRSTRAIFMNTELAPFNVTEVRQAVAAAIDRDQMSQLRAGHIEKADRIMPRGVVGYDDSFRGQSFAPDGALELMRRAGLPFDPVTGKGGYPETIDYVVPSDSFDQQVAELFQQHLARIGIRIRIKAMTWTASQAAIGRRKQCPMGAHGWVADYDDPSDFFEPLFATSAIQEEESSNSSFYSNPKLDRILADARGELDPAKRKALYRQAEEIVRDDAPWAIVYGYRYYDVWQPYLRGYRPHPHYFQELQRTWLDLEQRNRFRQSRQKVPLSVQSLALSLAKVLR